MRLVLCALCAILGAASAHAADIYNGREVYQLHCESCHGSDGRSLEPGTPDFSMGESMYRPDTDLVRLLRDGKGVMPAYRGLLSDAELRNVIAYVRSLQR